MIFLILFAKILFAQQIKLTSYHFAIKSNGTSSVEKLITNDENILNKPDEELIQNFNGNIFFTPLNKIKGNILFEVKVVTNKYELLNGNQEAINPDFVIAALQTPFYITADKNGNIRIRRHCANAGC